jgi:hypothetical protein
MPAFSLFLGALMFGAFAIGDDTAGGAAGGVSYVLSIALLRRRA